MTKIWTTLETAYLEQNYPTLGRNKCAEYLGRSAQSCANKAMRLGLQVLKHNKTHAYYLQELFDKEINYIPLEQYQTGKIKILHECINNHKFMITPASVLAGHGCQECLKYTHEEYISKTNFKVLESYINMRTKISHKCDKGHIWKAEPRAIIEGNGCPSCAKRGFDPEKPAILYYIKITKDYETYYKLGITNRTVSERFRDDRDKTIEVIWIEKYEIGKLAQDKERALLLKYKDKRVNIEGFLKAGGNSELFEVDILTSL